MCRALAMGGWVLGLVILTAPACDGRSIGNGGPVPDGGPIVPDARPPVVVPDAALPPPDAGPGCEGSPLQGLWYGSFSGQVYSDLTGDMDVMGTVQIQIYCEETLLVHGVMEGSEQSGVPFEAEVEGDFDEVTGELRATWAGTVYVVPATGSLEGLWSHFPQERISGNWQGIAPEVQGTGNGQWMVSR